MDTLENQYKIELFKRYLPRVCDVINKHNTYAFVLKFDNDTLTINNVRVEIEYHVGKLEAHSRTEPEAILATFEMPHCHVDDFPFLHGLDNFISDIVNKLDKKKMLDNIADLSIGRLTYDYNIKDFSTK